MLPVCPGYGIKERLGEGGFGTVYRAERKKDRRVRSSDLPQLITSQVYAIKVVKLCGHVESRPSGGGDLRPESVVSTKRRVIHRGRGAQICETCCDGILRKRRSQEVSQFPLGTVVRRIAVDKP
jgi:serine/threonine protein kinase